MFKLHGVVVLFNPDNNVLCNVQTYLSEVDMLYVVDNSEVKNEQLVRQLEQYEHLVYIDNGSNKGIATALNIGAKNAISNGATWLLTMDQDSYFVEKSLFSLIAVIKSSPKINNIGIYSPFHVTVNVRSTDQSSAANGKLISVDTVMTSGNIINLAAYQDVGGFLDKYFIDCVDHEYCLALSRKNYEIMVLTSSTLEHSLGDIEYVQWSGHKIYYTNHSATRRYYITRNRLDLVFRHGFYFPVFASRELYKLLVEWFKILLFEKNKMKKTFYIMKGISDFVFRRFGKLS